MHRAALWYLTRGTGLVALLLLTGSLVLGIVHADRRRPLGAPRMIVDSAHRTISLLVVVLLTIHVATAVLDSFAPVALLDAVIPFTGSYRPFWLGLGALALDLLVAVTITSVLRARLGHRVWRGVHWMAYACWPVAVLHGLGTGSDTKSRWTLLLTLGCVVLVVGFTAVRLARGNATGRGRNLGFAALGAAVLGLAIWLPAGPLAPHWARRSGTPAGLLAFSQPKAAVGIAVRRPPAAAQFSSSLTGRARRGVSAHGTGVIDLSLRAPGGPAAIRLRLAGQPLAEGGLAMNASAVTLVDGGTYVGRIGQLQGNDMSALVGAPDGRVTRLRLHLVIQGASVTGRASAQPVTPVTG
jgi:DMSO/TMAO reductase YedYZ heme-binding membrane subunit